MTIGEARRMAQNCLEEIGATHEVREMMQALLDCTWTELISADRKHFPENRLLKLKGWIEERLQGKPLAYILQKWSFMDLPLIVSEDVLIPREDTECLVNAGLALAKERGYRSALDLCTGSGCIAIALAKYGDLQVEASDISEKALMIAKENVKINQLDIVFHHKDLLEGNQQKYDMIFSNPPYIKESEREGLQREVAEFEPPLALFAGEDGLDFYRRIAKDARENINSGGALMMEIGMAQAEEVGALLKKYKWQNIRYKKDFAGIDRVIVADLD